jgi:hypothetical protein
LSGITDKDDDPSGPVTALEPATPGRGKAAPGGADKRRTGNRHASRPAGSAGAAAGAGPTFAGANLVGAGPIGERPPVRVSSGNAIGGPRFAGRGPVAAASPSSPASGHAEQAEGPDESFFDQDLLG